MFLEIPSLLNPAEVTRLASLARELRFVDGKLSNPHNITKSNLQADQGDPRYGESAKVVMEAFARSRAFNDFALPVKIAPPLLARYEPGMKYGPHADVAFMAAGTAAVPMRLRSDLSCTVFLNDPNSYDGGELVLHLGTRPIPVKGYPGDAFIYPSTLLHEVRPVNSGQRLVSITFIQSVVPDEQQRNVIYELRDVWALEATKMDWVNRARMEVVIENLTRTWSRS